MQVSYLRHSYVGKAATSNVEFSNGWPIISLKKLLNLFSLPRPMKSSLEMGSSLKDRPAVAEVPDDRVRVFLNQAGECTVKQIHSGVQQFLTPHRGAGQDELFFPGSPHTTILPWGQGCHYSPRCHSNMDFEYGSGDKQYM